MQTLADCLYCPVCATNLTSAVGGFECLGCQRVYQIVDGVPDLFVSLSETEAIDDVNKTWLDPDIVAARNLFYGHCTRELKGMAFCMREIGQRTFSGCRILEVGMGTGHFTHWLAEEAEPGTHIFAFDMSWPIIETAKANTLGCPDVHLFRANSRGRLPVDDESFDIVLTRLAPLGARGISNAQAAFPLLKPGGWHFDAGWKRETSEVPVTEFFMQQGFEYAEHHTWRYALVISSEAHRSSQVELVRMAELGGKKAQQAEALQPTAELEVLSNGQQMVRRQTVEDLVMARKPE